MHHGIGEDLGTQGFAGIRHALTLESAPLVRQAGLMTAHAILLPADDFDATPTAAELVGRGVDAFIPELPDIPTDVPATLADARRVAYIAMWLNREAVPSPAVIVAPGSAARLLPALALAQRSAARLVTGYVIVDAPAPSPAMDWPDAPVWWVTTAAASNAVRAGATGAGLRGFEVVDSDDVAGVVAQVAAGR